LLESLELIPEREQVIKNGFGENEHIRRIIPRNRHAYIVSGVVPGMPPLVSRSVIAVTRNECGDSRDGNPPSYLGTL